MSEWSPSESEMRKVAWRMLGGYDLTPFDLRVVGWCQRQHHPICAASYTESEDSDGDN